MKNLDSARTGAVLTSLARDRGLWAYNALSLLGAPLFLWRKYRLLRYINLDCEFDPARWQLRFPRALKPQSKREPTDKSGPRVQFVTLGWGEVATMEPLAQALRAARPDAVVGFTVKHREAIPLASQLSDEEVWPLPFDRPLPVARWHQRARPDLVVFYERFNLATLLRSLWLRRVPFVIVHARMSARRANNRSSPNLKFKRWQLRGLRDILLPSPDYAPGTAQIAPDEANLHVVGSIKFPHVTPQLPPARDAALRAWIEAGTAGAPLLVAGSTHPAEEAFVLDAWQQVRAALPDAAPVLLLAPRKPDRTDEVLRELNARNLRVSRRSQWDDDARGDAQADERSDTPDDVKAETTHRAQADARGDAQAEATHDAQNANAQNTNAQNANAQNANAQNANAQNANARNANAQNANAQNANAQNQAVDVLLLDTLGELGVAYSYATGAFVGGTLSADAHNVAEPLVWSIPVAYGPKRGNFGVEQTLCEAAGVGFRIETPDELAAHWTKLLESDDLRRELATKAENLLAAQRDAFARTLQILLDAVDSVSA